MEAAMDKVYYEERNIVSRAKGYLSIADGNKPIPIDNVMIVPDLTRNVLSVGTLINKGFTVTFEGENCVIHRKGRAVLEATLINDLYAIITKRSDIGEDMSRSTNQQAYMSNLNYWSLDWEAKQHMCINVNNIKGQNRIIETDDKNIYISGFLAWMKNENEIIDIPIKNIRLVPDLVINVISADLLINKGFDIRYEGEMCSIVRAGTVVMTAFLNEELGLYLLTTLDDTIKEIDLSSQALKEEVEQMEKKDKTDESPLHLSAHISEIFVEKTLIENKVNINSKEIDEWTSIHLTAGYGNNTSFLNTPFSSSNVCYKKKDKMKLHLATIDGNGDIAMEIIRYIDIKYKQQTMEINYTARARNFAIVTELINNGVNIESKHVNDWSAMFLVASKGLLEVVKELIKHKKRKIKTELTSLPKWPIRMVQDPTKQGENIDTGKDYTFLYSAVLEMIKRPLKYLIGIVDFKLR